MVALMMVLPNAPSIVSASTSRSRSSDGRNPATLVSSHAPASGSRVLPTAIVAAASGAIPPVTLMTKAPRVTAGQYRNPIKSSAARAMPEGGHADETTGCTADAVKPSLPATT